MNYRVIESTLRRIQLSPMFSMGEILKPFFGRREIIRGEHEVIALAFHLYQTNAIRNFILDDEGGRRYVQSNLAVIERIMIGTVGFIALCFCELQIIEKGISLSLLGAIETSNFRVPKEVLINARNRIKDCG